METKILNLRTDNYYTLEEELCFFMDPGRYSKFSEQVQLLANDLMRAEYVTCNHLYGSENRDYYIMMTRNYQIFADRSERQNFRITNIRWGRDFQENKKKMYSNGAFLIIAKAGIKLVVKKEAHSYGYTYWPATSPTDSDCMSASGMSDLCDAINSYFENDNRTDETKVGRLFDRQIIQPLNNYTYYEQEAERLAVYGDNYMDYDRFKIVNSGARQKCFDFYSMSFDPDNGLFSIGSRVAVETSEEINDERKRMLKGKVLDFTLEEEGVRLRVEFTQQFDYLILPEKHGRIFPQADETQTRVRKDVIKNIWNGTIESKYMYQLFSSYRGSGYEPQPGWKEFRQGLMNQKYPPNQSQMEAIQNGIETKDIQLVMGPPGTGKTTVIGSWVEYFIQQGKRVLVSSQNNAAVDNVLERVGKNPKARIVRLGNIDKIQENCKKYSAEWEVDKKAEEYIQQLQKSRQRISSDVSLIKNMIAIVDEAEGLYRTKEYYEERLKVFGNQLRLTSAKTLDSYDTVCQAYNQYKEYHDQKVHKQVYLYAIKQKSKFVQMLHLLTTRRAERDIPVLQDMEEQAIQEYINGIKAYNAASVRLQQELSADEYHNTYKMVHLLNRRCNLYSYSLSLRGPFHVQTLSLPKNVDAHIACEKLKDYQIDLNNLVKRLLYVGSTLDDWEKCINSNRTEVVTKLRIQNSNVVGATCIGINSSRWANDLEFDISIIDECGQIQIHDIMVPMTRAPKTLLLGDHKQIPPHVNEDVKALCKQDGVDTELLEKSFFEFLFNKLEDKDCNTRNITRLNEQFRMPGMISDVIANQFYEGNYHAHYNMNNWNSMIQGERYPLVIYTTSKSPKRFDQSARNSSDKSPGYSNLLEARTIAKIVSQRYFGSPEEIGIISAYSRQVRLIRKELKQREKGLSSVQINSMVATLDSFQGQERPLIIYSLTRSSKDLTPEQARVGFLKELRRLNVAFTRSQKQLVIIGDIDYLTSCKYKELDPETKKPLPYKDEEEFSKFLRSMEKQAERMGEIHVVMD